MRSTGKQTKGDFFLKLQHKSNFSNSESLINRLECPLGDVNGSGEELQNAAKTCQEFVALKLTLE